MSFDDLYEKWSGWAEREITSFYEAIILELLDSRTHSQGSAVSSFRVSLTAARLHNSITTDDLADDPICDIRVPARIALEARLEQATLQQARDYFWRFIHSWPTIARAAESVADKKNAALQWIHRLVEASFKPPQVEAPDMAASGSVLLKLLNVEHPKGLRELPFDPVRTRVLVQCVKDIFAIGKRSAIQDKILFKRIDDTREDFIRTYIRTAKDCGEDPETEPEKPRTNAYKVFDLKESSDTENVLRRRAEELWWSSFSEEDGPRVADFCYGGRFASWNVPRSAFTPAHVIKLLGKKSLDHGQRARRPPSVVVFGAGIAGLTAAHELAIRGFSVAIVEAARTPRNWEKSTCLARDKCDPMSPARADVGGLARTQWSEALKDPGTPRQVATRDENTPKPFPGEHGYRFFPSFYRHIFDTMKRTPLRGAPAGLYPTAFDQLQPTYQQIFARRSRPVPLSRARPRSLEAFRKEYMQLVEGLEFERRDIARFFFKLVRYLMTCTARRTSEYENLSFLQFLGGREFYSRKFIDAVEAAPQALVAMDAAYCDARTQGNIYLQLLMDQVLGGEYTDATLRGPTSEVWLDPWRDHLTDELGVRLYNAELLNLKVEKSPSGSSNYDYTVELELPPGRGGQHDGLNCAVEEADYYVIALDAVSAEQVTRKWSSAGVPSELRGFSSYVEMDIPAGLERFDVVIPYEPPQEHAEADARLREILARISEIQDDASPDLYTRSAFRSVRHVTGELVMAGSDVSEISIALWCQRKIGVEELESIEQEIRSALPYARDARLKSLEPDYIDTPIKVRTPRLPSERYGDSPRDRFQTFTGIQYYFEQDFQLVRGHVYFPDTDWGLSAVSQSQFWANHLPRPPDVPTTIRGVLSVDIGDCRAESTYTHKCLMESSADEIQQEVWRQITDSLRTTRGETSTVTSLRLPAPKYYHLDQNLQFSGNYLRANRTPFLINNAGDWENRPRCMPWVPGQEKRFDLPRTDAPGVWQAAHGGYRVHADKVVFCGHYMRTFTRMTTMEAANESARHAVNAILDHLAWAQGPLVSPFEPVSGDYCQIWDIEQNELEDLDFFKRVDEMLFKAGKPHIADILQFDKIADLQHPELSPMQALLTALGSQVGKDWGIQPQEIVGSLRGLFDVARRFGEQLGGGYGGEGSAVQRLLTLLGGKGGGSKS